jgi:hypothetical protein
MSSITGTESAPEDKVNSLVSFLKQKQLEQQHDKEIEECKTAIHEELLGLHILGVDYDDILDVIEFQKRIWTSRLVVEDLVRAGWLKEEAKQ